MNTELMLALAKLAVEHGPELVKKIREIFEKKGDDPQLIKQFDAAIRKLEKNPEEYFGPRHKEPAQPPRPPEPPWPTPEPSPEPPPVTPPNPPSPPAPGETFGYYKPLKNYPMKPPLVPGDKVYGLPDGKYWATSRGFGAPLPQGARLMWEVT